LSPASQAASPCGGRSPSHDVTRRKPCATPQPSHRDGVPPTRKLLAHRAANQSSRTGFGLTCHLAKLNRRRAICRSAMGDSRSNCGPTSSGLVPSDPVISLQPWPLVRVSWTTGATTVRLAQPSWRSARSLTDHRHARHRDGRQTQRQHRKRDRTCPRRCAAPGGHSVTVGPVPLSSDVGALWHLGYTQRTANAGIAKDTGKKRRGEHARSGL
jgi:hypothetical protein